MSTSLKQLLVLLERVEGLFPSPANVPEGATAQVFEMACAVDELASTVVGGMRAKSLTTGSVVEAVRQIDALLVERGPSLAAGQLQALHDLRDALSQGLTGSAVRLAHA